MLHKDVFYVSLERGIIWSKKGEKIPNDKDFAWGFTISKEEIVKFVNSLALLGFLVIFYGAIGVDFANQICGMFDPKPTFIYGSNMEEVHARALLMEKCPKVKIQHFWDTNGITSPLIKFELNEPIKSLIPISKEKKTVYLFVGNHCLSNIKI